MFKESMKIFEIDQQPDSEIELLSSVVEVVESQDPAVLPSEGRGKQEFPRKPVDQRHRPARFPHTKILSEPAAIVEWAPSLAEYSTDSNISFMSSMLMIVHNGNEKRREKESKNQLWKQLPGATLGILYNNVALQLEQDVAPLLRADLSSLQKLRRSFSNIRRESVFMPQKCTDSRSVLRAHSGDEGMPGFAAATACDTSDGAVNAARVSMALDKRWRTRYPDQPYYVARNSAGSHAPVKYALWRKYLRQWVHDLGYGEAVICFTMQELLSETIEENHDGRAAYYVSKPVYRRCIQGPEFRHHLICADQLERQARYTNTARESDRFNGKQVNSPGTTTKDPVSYRHRWTNGGANSNSCRYNPGYSAREQSSRSYGSQEGIDYHHRRQDERRNVGMEEEGHRAWTPTEEQQAATRESKVHAVQPQQIIKLERTGERSLRPLVLVRDDEGTVSIREKEAKMLDSDREFLLYEEDENVGELISVLCPEVMVRVCGVETPVLLDSGAKISCVSEELVTELEGKGKPFILGTDFLTQHKILLHFGGWFIITPDDIRSKAILPDKWHVTNMFVGLLKLDYPVFQLYNTPAISVSQSQNLNEGIMQAVAAAIPGLYREFEAKIRFIEGAQFHAKSYPIPAKFLSTTQEYLQVMLDWKVVKREASSFSSPIVCVPKKDGSVRLCLDARSINNITVKDRAAPTQTSDILRRFWGPIGEESKGFARAYVDDILITSAILEEHVQHVRMVIEKLSENELPFLGHIITPEGAQTALDKLEAITQFPPPANVRQLRTFLAIIGFYGNYSDQDQQWRWLEAEQEAFERLKAIYLDEHVIYHPVRGKEFLLYMDASDYALGCRLAQFDSNEVGKTVAMASRTMSPAERNYTVTEKEALAIIWALNKFRDILFGEKMKLLTDHQALTCLKDGKTLGNRLTRWCLLLQEYDIEVMYTKGSENVTADYLSRLPGGQRCRVSGNEASNLSQLLSDMGEMQRQDQFCGAILQNLAELPQDHKLHRTFSVIPQEIALQVTQEMHEALGHIGSIKLYDETLRRQMYWTKMQQDVQKVVTSRELCQKNAKVQILLGKVRSFVDEVGKPRAILSNNGSQFTSHVWQKGLKRLSIVPTTAPVRSPRSNPVERRMSLLGTVLRMYCHHEQQAWRDKIPLVEFVMNHTIHASTGFTPYEVLTNKRSEIVARKLLSKLLQADKSFEENSMPTTQEVLLDIVKRKLYSSAESRQRQQKLSRVNKFHIDDLVLKKTSYLSSSTLDGNSRASLITLDNGNAGSQVLLGTDLTIQRRGFESRDFIGKIPGIITN
ncbi:hypothetical protein PR048_029280 [Dryococelus australis]|uniref:RNA-directed DNA polymerase n=1 Tax=Dryococelus australis TaxID=614101 RepID=A0ABQ9GCW8_9NEOP|nr:hypothetical protein PR048_029280 [Dryococelus australis]